MQSLMKISLQDQFAKKSICFGCGPANQQGLQIKSFVSGGHATIDNFSNKINSNSMNSISGDIVIANWRAQAHHEAFPGMVNGGIIGSLLDCHCNWTAAWALKNKFDLAAPPCTVTAEYTIKLLRPTPSQAELTLKALAVEVIGDDRVWVEGDLTANDKVTAKCRGLFVAVKEGHPAFHRW